MKMFDHRHYVPVLRWKRAEWIALLHVHSGDRVRITPLIEPVPLASDPDALQKHGHFTTGLPEVAKELEKSWGGQPIFVDFLLWDSPLKAKGTHPLETFWKSVSGRWLEPICVTGLHRSEAYQRQMAEIAATCGKVCLRLTTEDLQGSDLAETVDRLLSSLAVEPARTHLVVDYQDHWPAHYVNLCRVLPFLESWGTFTVLSGSFPRDLQSFKIGQHLHPRREWLSWRSQVAKSAFLPRKPTFGDYTVQHAVYQEPPDRANFSASIRYTAEDDWVVMRGEGVFSPGSPGFSQWPANARLLCDRAEYCGSAFSAGDKYIWQKALDPRKTGNAETWLRAAINHHLTFVVRQIVRTVSAG